MDWDVRAIIHDVLKFLMEGANDIALKPELLANLFHGGLVVAGHIVEVELEQENAVHFVVALKLDVKGSRLRLLKPQSGQVSGMVLGIERIGRFGTIEFGDVLP